MRTRRPPLRLLACVLVVVLAITAATPAPAEADVLTAIAIGSLIVAGVILIAYLVIANVDDSRHAELPRIVWLTCTACASILASDAASPVPPPPQTL